MVYSALQLNEQIDGETLIIADLEGHETVLLDPHKASRLRDADLLVEIHDDAQHPGHATTEQQITSRFAVSHRIERRISGDREAWLETNRPHWRGKMSRDRSFSERSAAMRQALLRVPKGRRGPTPILSPLGTLSRVEGVQTRGVAAAAATQN